jgi:hypothetical protein
MNELSSCLSDFVIREIKGTEYKFGKINLGILADFSSFMAGRKLKQGLDALGKDASYKERAMLIQQMSYSNMGDDIDALQSLPAMKIILYLCLKEYQPDITEKETGKLFGIKDLGELKDLIGELLDTESGVESESEDLGESKNEMTIPE